MKDKLWFFTSARYFSVNNFIANTFFDDGSQGMDDQFIKSAHGAPDLADRRRATSSRRTSTRSTSTAATTCRATTIRRRRRCSGSRPRITPPGVKWTSTVTSRMLLEAGFSSNLEYYTNSYQEGVEQPRGTAAWFANASRTRTTSAAAQTRHTSPDDRRARRATRNAGVDLLRDRRAQHQVRLPVQWGDFIHTVDANGDLTQQDRSTSDRRPLHGARQRASIRNTPLAYGERLNHDLGIYVQDSWRLTA